MPKWEEYLNSEEETPTFEKFNGKKKIARKMLDLVEEEILTKRQKERERDEERISKHRSDLQD